MLVYTFLNFLILKNLRFSAGLRNLLLLLSLVGFLNLYSGENSDWQVYKTLLYLDRDSFYFEPLFTSFFILARSFVNFQGILVLIFLPLLFVFYKVDKLAVTPQEKSIIRLSLFIGFIPLYGGALRQTIAYEFLLILLLSPNVLKKLIFMLIAFGNHYSALIYFPSSFMMSTKNISKSLGIIVLASVNLILILKLTIIGEIATRGNFYISSADSLKDYAIMAERIIMIISAIRLLRVKNLNVFIQSALFFVIFSSLIFILGSEDYRNFSGRLLAYSRGFDVLVIYYITKTLFKQNHRYIISITVSYIYFWLKYIITIGLNPIYD